MAYIRLGSRVHTQKNKDESSPSNPRSVTWQDYPSTNTPPDTPTHAHQTTYHNPAAVGSDHSHAGTLRLQHQGLGAVLQQRLRSVGGYQSPITAHVEVSGRQSGEQVQF